MHRSGSVISGNLGDLLLSERHVVLLSLSVSPCHEADLPAMLSRLYGPRWPTGLFRLLHEARRAV